MTWERKVFCIGLNKTGTTSIGDALQALGLKRLGWRGGLSSRLTLRWHEGNRDAFLEPSREFDAFEDLPWPLVYQWMDEEYPNAKFILTTRSSTETWLRSIQGHIRRRGGRWIGHFLVYGSYDPFADGVKYAAVYEAHNAAVRRYFEDRSDKLLEMTFEQGDGWQKLCKFLGYGREPRTPFPHSNKREAAA